MVAGPERRLASPGLNFQYFFPPLAGRAYIRFSHVGIAMAASGAIPSRGVLRNLSSIFDSVFTVI
jgi:hypothetical protein